MPAPSCLDSEFRLGRDDAPQSPMFGFNPAELPDLDEETWRSLDTYVANLTQENLPDTLAKSSTERELESWDPVLPIPDNGSCSIEASLQHDTFLPTHSDSSPVSASLNDPMAGPSPDSVFPLVMPNDGDTVAPHTMFLHTGAESSPVSALLNDQMAGILHGCPPPHGLSDTRGWSFDTTMPNGALLTANTQNSENPDLLNNPMDTTLLDFMPPFDPLSLSVTGGFELLEQYLYGGSGLEGERQ